MEERAEKDYGLTPVEKFMMIFGSFGQKTTVHSHEPHAILRRQQEGFEEAKRQGYITTAPFNRYGSITIRCTDAGEAFAKAAYRKVAEVDLPALSKAEGRSLSAASGQEGGANG